MTANDKNKERMLRRRLEKAGAVLHKSRIKQTHADNFGGYMIVDAYSSALIAGGRFDLDIDDVKVWTEYLESIA